MASCAQVSLALRRVTALLLAGMFALMVTGLAHEDCAEGEDHGGKAEHVLACQCACHHHLQVPLKPISLAVAPEESRAALPEPLAFTPETEPDSIFHPPKTIV